jgi:hypothetical protein
MTRTLLLAALIALVFATAPALASTVIDGGSIFGAWRPYIVEIVGIAIAAVVGWIVNLVRTRLGLEIEARHREALQTALTNAAGLAINQLGGAAGGLRVDVRSAALAEAVTYVLKGAPDALRYFGLTEDRLRDMIAAKVGVSMQPTA